MSAPDGVRGGLPSCALGDGHCSWKCAGTAIRQGAASVKQVEIMPMPPETRSASTPWPAWPWMLRITGSKMTGALLEHTLRNAQHKLSRGTCSC